MPVERVDGVEADVGAVCDERAKRRRIVDRCLHQHEVLGTVVVQDQEAVLATDDGVLDRVLDAVTARQDRDEFGFPPSAASP